MEIDRSRVKRATDTMSHRGPDASRQWVVDGICALGHRRLSIIDLSSSNDQPFVSLDGRFALTFNGEIYNYIELRRELEQLGHTFRTTGDTEVLLASYTQWGAQCVRRFNGDWAFAIFDVAKRALFCSRDRFGVKPLNYAVFNGQLVVASEIKAIVDYVPALRRPNHNVIANFCRNGLGAQSTETWFAGVFRLQPGHNLLWRDGQLRVEQYWQYPEDADATLSLEDASAEYRELFMSAVRLRLRSDVPVGTTLSSGLDSTSIVAAVRTLTAAPHHTFTAVFEPGDFQRNEKAVYGRDIEIDEARSVLHVAKQFDLTAHLVDCRTADILPLLAHVIRHLESGHSSPATIPLNRILDEARGEVRVLLEGQGADELLGGYVINMLPVLVWQLMKHGSLLSAVSETRAFQQSYSLSYAAKVFVRLQNQDTIERLYQRASGIHAAFGPLLSTYERIDDFPADLPEYDDDFTRALCRSHAGGLVNLLHYGDALSMANSIESRLPFMDVNLVEFSMKLPYRLKMRDGFGKYIHRHAMRGIVPPRVLGDPIKLGFNTPLARHFAPDQVATQLLLSDRCLSRGTFDERGLRAVLSRQIAGTRDYSTFLFRCLSTELWWRWFMDEDDDV